MPFSCFSFFSNSAKKDLVRENLTPQRAQRIAAEVAERKLIRLKSVISRARQGCENENQNSQQGGPWETANEVPNHDAHRLDPPRGGDRERFCLSLSEATSPNMNLWWPNCKQSESNFARTYWYRLPENRQWSLVVGRWQRPKSSEVGRNACTAFRQRKPSTQTGLENTGLDGSMNTSLICHPERSQEYVYLRGRAATGCSALRGHRNNNRVRGELPSSRPIEGERRFPGLVSIGREAFEGSGDLVEVAELQAAGAA